MRTELRFMAQTFNSGAVTVTRMILHSRIFGYLLSR